MNTTKLLQLADLLESRSNLSLSLPLREYNQSCFYHRCGSPGCALGLWGFVQEHWKVMVIRSSGVYNYSRPAFPIMNKFSSEINYDRPSSLGDTVMKSAKEEFEITDKEFNDIFGAYGCNSARDELSAASYIRELCRKDIADPIFVDKTMCCDAQRPATQRGPSSAVSDQQVETRELENGHV